MLERLEKPKNKKKGKRLGRGYSSGKGLTAGRGTKGQRALSGGGKPVWFEGGQMPLTRRIPKRGFHNINKVEYEIVNLFKLEEKFEPNEEVTPETLRKKGLVKRNLPVKILGMGDLKKSLNVKVHAISAKAKEKIESAGGKIELINRG